MTMLTTSCATCVPPADGPYRLTEGHVGVRFGDAPTKAGRWLIQLDGQDVTDRCIEATPASPTGGVGWVVMHDKPKVVCSDDHLRTSVHLGDVEVRFSPSTHPRTPAVSGFSLSPRL